MNRPRIIMADSDYSYLMPLQSKIASEYLDKIDLEIITDKLYLKEMFSNSISADILIISQSWFDDSIRIQDIKNIFVLTELLENSNGDGNIHYIYKYTSIKEIFIEITGKCGLSDSHEMSGAKKTQLIVISSANGGIGKTTVSMGISAALAKRHKRVLYINASSLQTFHHMLSDVETINDNKFYIALNGDEISIDTIIGAISREDFDYLPPFKRSLLMLGLDFSVFEKIVSILKASVIYDYIIVDLESRYDDTVINLLTMADKVIVLTMQSYKSVFSTNTLLDNIHGISSDKYIFICNKFDKERKNILTSTDFTARFPVSDYIRDYPDCDCMSINELSDDNDIKKIAFLIL
ncbi:MAG: AAA family ATPase [Acutalibacteraceae bacterium]